MAATDVDEESWLYGEGYGADSKANHGVNNKAEVEGRSGSPLLDDLDDVIVNAEIKQQHRTNRIVSVSSSLQPKATTPSEDAKTPVVDEDGVFDMEREGEEGEGRGTGGTEEEEEEEEESESDDDDVQIVIGPIENPPAPFYQGRLPSTSNTVLGGAKKVDVDAVPTIGGQTLFEIDLDSADKPWRLPGADITDYFNYGFTEETWRLYCEKQRRTKTEVAQLNKIAVHTTRIATIPKPGVVSSLSTIPSIGGTSLPPPPIHPFPLPPAGIPLPHTLLPPPPLPHLPTGMLPPVLPEAGPLSSQESSTAAQTDQDDGTKTPETDVKEEGSEGRATPGVDQETPEVLPPTGKVPLLPPPPTSLAPPPFSMPPSIRTNTSGAPDVSNPMAAMLSSLRQHDPPFPGFLPPPGFPPPFHPQLPGGDFRPRLPPFHGGPPPPFPLLPGGPLDVPGILPPPLDERGLPIHPDLGLPGGTWDPSMGPPPPELFDMMARREDYGRASRSPSRSGSSGRSRSRSRSSSYDNRARRRRDKRPRRHSRSRSHSRERERDHHGSRSRRSHRSSHHRSDRHDRDRDRDRDREREREKERERDRRRREERSRRERSRRHRSSSRDREEDRSSTGGGGRSTRDRKTKEPPPREERSHSRTPP